MKNLLRVAVAGIAAWLVAGPAVAVPVLWPANGHYYEVVSLPGASWDAARADAQSRGAGWDLATITSLEEQLFIASLLGVPPVGGITEYWVGGYQPGGSAEPGGNWQWINGEGLFWDSGPVAGAFSYWGGVEPNNLGGENHLALDNRNNFPNWGWNDNDPTLSAIYGYVAETPVPEPGTLSLLGLGLASLIRARRRRG